jgi:endonuclease/exonuclease/phosphatase family metal-dependent hydrolase
LLILKRLHHMAPKGSAVLMGDLNAGPEADCIAELTSRASGFKSALPPSSDGTYHGFSGVAEGPPIDWIFYRGDLVKESAAVVTNRYAGRYPSDHFPICVSLRPLVSK